MNCTLLVNHGIQFVDGINGKGIVWVGVSFSHSLRVPHDSGYRSGRDGGIHSQNGGRCVSARIRNATTKEIPSISSLLPSASGLPQLNLNQPSHKIKVHRVASGRLYPGIAVTAPPFMRWEERGGGDE